MRCDIHRITMLLMMTCFGLTTCLPVLAQHASSQTSDALHRVEQQIEENVQESHALLAEVMKDDGTATGKIRGLKQENIATDIVANEVSLPFRTGPTETETIFVQGPHGDTGIGLYSPPINEDDALDVVVSHWKLLDATGKGLLNVPNNHEPLGGSISAAVSGRLPHWAPPQVVQSGEYLVQTDIVGMEPFPISVRQGYITWVKVPHAALHIDWEQSLHHGLLESHYYILILDANGQAILSRCDTQQGLTNTDASWRKVVKPGHYTVTLAAKNVRSAHETEATALYNFAPAAVTAAVGTITHYKLPLAGYTISTDRSLADWAVLSPDEKYRIGRGRVSHDNRHHDSQRVYIFHPGRYKLIWGDSWEMTVNRQYEHALDFAVSESEIRHLVLPEE